MKPQQKPAPKAAAPYGYRTADDADRVTAAMIGLDEIATTMERRWGMGRLIRLCRDNSRLSFRRGWVQWQEAALAGDAGRMLTIIAGLKLLWGIMDAQAVADGHRPLAPDVWEVRLDDGTVLALCRTNAEAAAVQREGRATVAYSLQEVARLLPKLDLLGAVKVEFSGAVVERVIQTSEGHAESWATNDPFHEILHGDEA